MHASDQRTEQARNDRRKPPAPKVTPEDDAASPQDADEQRSGEQPNQDAETPSETATQQPATKGDSKNADKSKQSADEGDKAEGEEEKDSADDRTGDNAADGQQGKNGKGDQKQSASKQDANGSSENNSILNKMKDAMQNLLSRMKPQGNAGSQQQQMAGDQSKQQGKGQQNGGKQQAGKDGQPQNSGQQGDAQEGQAGEQAQNAQDPQSKGTGKSDSKQASKQPGSGIGSQDGDKNIKQAEQLAAMGKLSEIFGKRSANITGEATVEVRNTVQQLHTPYAQRGVQDSQGGAEINRDEVPVALQTYVEQYFEQVRKQAPPKK